MNFLDKESFSLIIEYIEAQSSGNLVNERLQNKKDREFKKSKYRYAKYIKRIIISMPVVLIFFYSYYTEGNSIFTSIFISIIGGIFYVLVWNAIIGDTIDKWMNTIFDLKSEFSFSPLEFELFDDDKIMRDNKIVISDFNTRYLTPSLLVLDDLVASQISVDEVAYNASSIKHSIEEITNSFFILLISQYINVVRRPILNIDNFVSIYSVWAKYINAVFEIGRYLNDDDADVINLTYEKYLLIKDYGSDTIVRLSDAERSQYLIFADRLINVKKNLRLSSNLLLKELRTNNSLNVSDLTALNSYFRIANLIDATEM